MKLYYAPGVCSIGIHVLLEEIGKPYDLQLVNLREGAQYKPPQAKLIPPDLETELRAMEAMEYAVATMHGQGFARIFRPGNFGPAEQEEQVKARGREIVENGFALIDKALAGKNYLGGNALSAADAALFYVEFWGAGRLGMKLPANCAAHYERMKARPAVQRVMQQEGVA